LSYDLNLIQEFVQQVAEAVSIVIKVDIVIIDANKNVVGASAGTRDPASSEYYHHEGANP